MKSDVITGLELPHFVASIDEMNYVVLDHYGTIIFGSDLKMIDNKYGILNIVLLNPEGHKPHIRVITQTHYVEVH